MAKVKVEGLRELEKQLAQLPKATARNVLKRTLKKAGKPIADKASALAPDDPRTPAPDLHTSIVVSAKINNPVGKAEFAAAMRAGMGISGARKAMRDARRAGAKDASFAEMFVGPKHPEGAHGVFQEFGTKNHAPHPFMRPAWDSEKQTALNIIRDEMQNEIMKAVKRLAKKAAKAKARG